MDPLITIYLLAQIKIETVIIIIIKISKLKLRTQLVVLLLFATFSIKYNFDETKTEWQSAKIVWRDRGRKTMKAYLYLWEMKKNRENTFRRSFFKKNMYTKNRETISIGFLQVCYFSASFSKWKNCFFRLFFFVKKHFV